jgi:hypothetical protein
VVDTAPSTAFGWFTVITTLSGFFAGWLTEWFRDGRARRREHEAADATSKREREARNDTRREQRFERRASFQRQTLLDLQDAVQKLLRVTGKMHHLDTIASRSGGEWHKQLYPDDVDNEAHSTNVQTILLGVRVRDDSIRSMAKELKEKCNSVLFSKNEADGDRIMLEAAKIFEVLNERIGERLRQLDDDEDAHDQKASAR